MLEEADPTTESTDPEKFRPRIEDRAPRIPKKPEEQADTVNKQ